MPVKAVKNVILGLSVLLIAPVAQAQEVEEGEELSRREVRQQRRAARQERRAERRAARAVPEFDPTALGAFGVLALGGAYLILRRRRA